MSDQKTERGTRRQGDKGTRGQGDKETRRQGGRNMKSILLIAFIAFVGSSAQAQWYPVTSGTTEHLHDIVFIDKDTGYCGGDGVILRTTDGGEGWETIFSADSLSVQNICIVKEKLLYAFALKSGASYLVSTVLSASPLDWSIRPISYRPVGVKVYNDAIYFVDLYGGIKLKKLKDDILSTVVHDVVGIFDISALLSGRRVLS